MKAFSVSHNGQKVAVIGASENCWLHVTVGGLVTIVPPTLQAHLTVSRAVIDDRAQDDPTLDTWPTPELSVGDEITIRIVDVESDDPPTNRPKRSPRRENRGDDFDFDFRFGRFK